MRVRELVFRDDPNGKAKLYACGECGTCYSPKTFCGPGATEQAQRFAEQCCTERVCATDGCDNTLGNKHPAGGQMYCGPCAGRRQDDRKRARFLKVPTKVHARDYRCPVDGYETSVYCDGYDDPVDVDDARGEEEWGFALKPAPLPQLDADDIVRSLCEDLWEDAYDVFRGHVPDLQERLDAWMQERAEQWRGSWTTDTSVAVVLVEGPWFCDEEGASGLEGAEAAGIEAARTIAKDCAVLSERWGVDIYPADSEDMTKEEASAFVYALAEEREKLRKAEA